MKPVGGGWGVEGSAARNVRHVTLHKHNWLPTTQRGGSVQNLRVTFTSDYFFFSVYLLQLFLLHLPQIILKLKKKQPKKLNVMAQSGKKPYIYLNHGGRFVLLRHRKI